MSMNNMTAKGDKALMHTYNRFPVVFDRGEGMYLYDVDGKKYLDFYAGIAVCCLGHSDEEFTKAIQEQAGKLLHISNYFYSQPGIEAAEKVIKASGMSKVFFTNSGAEAAEGALKAAKKYAYLKNKESQGYEVIAMTQSFHGRTMGSLSVTANPSYKTAFGPMVEGVSFAEFNNIDSVKEFVNDKTCAIILEPVQGEGGIHPADLQFLKEVRALCDDKDIMLIYDEVQCGMGRTGEMFAWQHYGVKPDIMFTAKSLGNGLPVGAFLTSEKASCLEPGDHGSTYGGNPLVCAGVSKVFDILESRELLSQVKRVGAYFEKKLNALSDEFDCIIERRGVGLMQALELNQPVGDVVKKALERGLVIITAGANTLRFLPALIVEERHVDEMIDILEKCLPNV